MLSKKTPKFETATHRDTQASPTGRYVLADKDITNLIQQLEAFEERLGVRIEAVSAFADDDDSITVRGELHCTDGTTLAKDVTIQLSVYDTAGRVIGTSQDYVDAESFFGFHTFEITCYDNSRAATKLRLFPTQ